MFGPIEGPVPCLEDLLLLVETLAIKENHPQAGRTRVEEGVFSPVFTGNAYLIGARESEPNLLGRSPGLEGGGLSLGMKPGEDRGELVASQAGDRIALAHRLPKAPGRRLKDLVSCRMAPEIVERLEVVEIDQNERPPLSSGGGLPKDPAEAVIEKAPVGNSGERILIGRCRQNLIFLEKLPHRRKNGGQVARLSRLPQNGGERDPERVGLSFLPADQDRPRKVTCFLGFLKSLGQGSRVEERGRRTEYRSADEILPADKKTPAEGRVHIDDEAVGIQKKDPIPNALKTWPKSRRELSAAFLRAISSIRRRA